MNFSGTSLIVIYTSYKSHSLCHFKLEIDMNIKSIKKGKVSVSKTIGMTLLTTLGTSLFLVMTGIGSNGGWIY